MNLKLPSFENSSIREFGASVLSVIYSGARQVLMENVDYSLLVFEDYLVNTATGEYRQIELTQDDDRAARIAETARVLLHSQQEGVKILLLLPPGDFVTTSYAMSVSGEKMVRSALQLQAHTSVPAYEDELMLGVDASRSQGVALWYPAPKADGLFRAFKKHRLFLAAIMPRSLAVATGPGRDNLNDTEAGKDMVISDEDARSLTMMLVEQGRVSSLFTVSRRDLAQEAFASQWEQETAHLKALEPFAFNSLDDWTSLKCKISPLANYCFLPRGAEQVGRQLQNRKRQKLAAGFAIAAVLLLMLPFVSNWVQIKRLEASVDSYRQQSTEARTKQDAVFAMEAQWGALYDYPDQDVVAILQNLNGYMENSLTSFSLTRGELEIQGYAQDPAVLVEMLAEDEAYFNVTQSRNISGGNSSSRGFRFGVRMNLSAYDFAEYESLYPVLNQ